jgi:hypothetical protein
MANGTIERPGVTVEQVFEAEAPTLIAPALPVVIIAPSKQIEFRQGAGSYSADTAALYAYPNLISGASVDLLSVAVHLFTSDGTFLIDPADYTATVSGVSLLAWVTTTDFVTQDQENGEFQADENIEDPATSGNYGADGTASAGSTTLNSAADVDFVAIGAKAGHLVEIFNDNDGGNDNGIYRIAEVTDSDNIVLRKEPQDEWTGFNDALTTAEFRVIADNSTFKDETVDFQQLGIVGGETMKLVVGTTEYDIEEVKSQTELLLSIEQERSLSGDTAIGDPGVLTVAGDLTQEILPGDKVVVQDGADVGIYEVDTVVWSDPNTIITMISGDAFTAAATVSFHTARTPASDVDVTYSVKEVRRDRNGTVLITYDADRTDLTGKLTQVESLDDLANKAGPPVPENPLSFGGFWAIQNTDTTVYLTGVNADTLTEHTSALDFLGNEEVYSLVPLTQDPATHQLYAAHVTERSAATAKKERIAWINRELFVQETKIEDADGTAATATNATPPAADSFVDAGADFTVAGIVAGDEITFTYTPSGGSETTQTIRVLDRSNSTTILLVEGLPSAFFTEWADGGTTGKSYTIKSVPLDKFQQAEFLADYSKSFANRRVYNVWPDLVELTYTDDTQDSDFLTQAELAGDGTPQTGTFTGVFPGYYLCAMYGGLVAGQDPQQPFTNLPITGATGLRNSNRYFTETQLDIIATGGTFIVIQDAEDGPVASRHQLSTDVTIIERRELSITKDVDFIAKFKRNSLREYIGKYNITQVYLEQLRVVNDSLSKKLVDDGQLISIPDTLRLEQSEEASDEIILDEDILVPFPANFIRVTLFI